MTRPPRGKGNPHSGAEFLACVSRDLCLLRAAYFALPERRASPFASFKQAWRELGFSRVHFACPRADDPTAYAQGLLHGALVRTLAALQHTVKATPGGVGGGSSSGSGGSGGEFRAAPGDNVDASDAGGGGDRCDAPAVIASSASGVAAGPSAPPPALDDALAELAFGVFCLYTLHATQRPVPKAPVRVSPESCLRLAEAKAMLLVRVKTPRCVAQELK